MSDSEKLRWLADARAEYVDGPFSTVDEFHRLSPTMQSIAREVMTVRLAADMLDGINDAFGWLPSWKWDEWDQVTQPTEPQTVEAGHRCTEPYCQICDAP